MYLVRGAPPLRRPYLASLSGWALPVAGTTDAQYFIMSMLFLQSRPLALVRSCLLYEPWDLLVCPAWG